MVFGNYSFFFKEVISVVGTALYAFLFTYLMLYLINLVTRVRVSEAEENEGLDFSIHGERAYDEGVL